MILALKHFAFAHYIRYVMLYYIMRSTLLCFQSSKHIKQYSMVVR